MFRSIMIWRALLACLSCCAPAAQSHAAPAQIVRAHASATIAPRHYDLTPYVRGDALIVHLQAREAGAEELLLDARTGAVWPGTLATLLRDYLRLGSENSSDVMRAGPQQHDLRLLAALGCSLRHHACTSPADSALLLFIAFDPAHSQLDFDIVDLRPPLDAVALVLAGRIEPATTLWGALEWQVIEFGARQAERREAWIDAVRSIDGEETFERVRGAMRAGPRLAEHSVFRSGADGDTHSIDLQGELELAVHKLIVGRRADAWLARPGGDAIGALAEAIERAARPPSQGRVIIHVVSQLAGLPRSSREQLARALSDQGVRRGSDDVRCFADWLLDRPCVSRAPPALRLTSAAPARLPLKNRPVRAEPAPARAPVREGMGGATAELPAGARAVSAMAGDAPEEWGLIRRVANKMLLFSFDESSGRLTPDQASVGGLTFIARSLGTVQEGRFAIDVAPNGRSPVRLAHGQYRVRARLALDYTREDSCRGGWRCLLAATERHAKVERREIVFYLNVGNRWSDRQPTAFGHLLPLVADGGERYLSQLKDVRLAVEQVQIDLN
jgi:hypothetical protein